MVENSIILFGDDGEKIELDIIEETKFGGVSYILTTEEGSEDCYILKDISKPDDTDAEYVFLDDDEEIESVFKIFEELIADTDTKIEI